MAFEFDDQMPLEIRINVSVVHAPESRPSTRQQLLELAPRTGIQNIARF